MASIAKFDQWQNSAGVNYNSIIQVVNTQKYDTWSTTSTAFVDVTGFNASITPKFSTSRVLIMMQICFSSPDSANWGGYHPRMTRNGTVLQTGTDVSGNQHASWGGGLQLGQQHNAFVKTFLFYDSPASTSSQTYQLQVAMQAYSGGTLYMNTSATKSTQYSGTGISTLTLMEIAQ